MPFNFTLPTISHLFLPVHLSIPTHPSLPLAATNARTVLRSTLKAHKRLPPAQQASNLSGVLEALLDYITHLTALVNVGQANGIELSEPLTSQWRSTGSQKTSAASLEAELHFSLSALASTHANIARSTLHPLFTSPSKTDKDKTLSSASASFLAAAGIASYVATRDPQMAESLEAVKQLMWAEATLCFVRKDDPYPAVVAQERDQSDRDWMWKAQEIGKARALLDARLCLGAAEHAGRAGAGGGGVGGFATKLRAVARARACRFFGMDKEMEGMTGEGIGWLKAAGRELGIKEEKGMMKLRKEWGERKEDRKIERGDGWGLDGGRWEEARVLDMLGAKWTKMNDTMNTQLIPDPAPLVASMPSGRECCAVPAYSPPTLDEAALNRLQAPPNPSDRELRDDFSDSDEEVADAQIPGAFPGVGNQLSGGGAYY
ncbi:MAG: hypothetical protein M1814_001320 [Vezdaea aestivalis]|nr:MAG: hypothetical protein M1814_001320 [Vezdaea aestivalis]